MCQAQVSLLSILCTRLSNNEAVTGSLSAHFSKNYVSPNNIINSRILLTLTLGFALQVCGRAT